MWTIGRDIGPLARLGGRLRPQVLAFHARYELSRWRARARPPGAPTALYVETSSFCRGRCAGCYVPVEERASRSTLDGAALAQLVEYARRVRPDYVCLVGGEPLDGPALDVNLALVEGAPELRFVLCTGGHGQSDAQLMHRLRGLSNLSLMFSIDGFPDTHDRHRGRGSHQRTLAAVRAYNGQGGQLCGASVTLRSGNLLEVTDFAFVDELQAVGCAVIAFDALFVGRDGVTAAELSTAIARLRRVARRSSAMFFVNPFGRLRRDGFDKGPGMIAASIDCHGNVYASRRGAVLGNVATNGLAAILEGEAFRRACTPLGEGACAADDPRRDLFEQVRHAREGDGAAA